MVFNCPVLCYEKSSLAPRWIHFKGSLNEPALCWCWLRKLLKYYLYRQYSKSKKRIKIAFASSDSLSGA